MARVICGLPNASDEINGVKFSLLADGRRISEEISDELAARFCRIPGYEADEADDDGDGDKPPAVAPTAPAAPVAPVVPPRLTKAQQKAAEKAAAEKAAAEAAEKAASEAAAAQNGGQADAGADANQNSGADQAPAATPTTDTNPSEDEVF